MQGEGAMSTRSTDASHSLFEALRGGFERALTTGVVQVFSDDPQLAFTVTVTESDLAFAAGTAESPTSTITMRGGVIHDLVSKAEVYDSRVVTFSSRLSLTGDKKLANFLLNLVMRPTASVRKCFEVARDLATKYPIARVEKVHRPGREIVRQALADFRPLLISGILDDWQVSSWNPKSLESHFGRYQAVSYLPWTIRNYTMQNAARYSGGAGLPGALAAQFQPPSALQSAATLGFPQLWLGSAQSEAKAVTGMHADCVHGFLCQVFGRKKLLLYSPDQEQLLYPFRAFNMYRACWTGPDVVDDERYPLFRQARPVEVTLDPGDVLLIPFGWYHCVYALDPVMSISYPVEVDQRIAMASGPTP
jgi:hypothetical protein